MKNPADKRKTINVRLLRKVQKMILAYPKAFDMASWEGRGSSYMGFDPKTMNEPNCGSACCIAGWTVTLGDNTSLKQFIFNEGNYIENIPERAEELLGITVRQADGIFHWKGRRRYLENVTAQEAAAMIDQFIANPLMFE